MQYVTKGLAMLPTLYCPPAFDLTFWPNEPRPPYHASCTTFSFGDFAKHVRFDEERSVVSIMGVEATALNLQLETWEEPNHPVYFEVTGRAYHYVFSVWADRVIIEVCGTSESYPVLSVMFPGTADQLQAALTTIAADLS